MEIVRNKECDIDKGMVHLIRAKRFYPQLQLELDNGYTLTVELHQVRQGARRIIQNILKHLHPSRRRKMENIIKKDGLPPVLCGITNQSTFAFMFLPKGSEDMFGLRMPRRKKTKFGEYSLS